MRNALRSEVLKAGSGFWMLAVLSYGLLLPFIMWSFFGGDPRDSLSVAPVAAAFTGCYLVTRDYYYGSIQRVVLFNSKQHVFFAKLVAGLVGGLATGLIGVLGWALLSAFEWRVAAGCVVGCGLAGVFGAAVGWVLPNYYLATFVALVVPLTAGTALATLYPEVGKYLPSNTFAGVIGVTAGLLPVWGSAGLALVWVAAVAFAGRALFLRRELS
jgi:ABC-2 type transport system permease protein